MKVIGVDCSSTTSMVFDGRDFQALRPIELDAALAANQDEPRLICWDAPLTGPPGVLNGVTDQRGAYSMRPIERFLRGNKNGAIRSVAGLEGGPPEGVSTLGYSGMSHWAVTRALLGLPRLGRFDAEPRFPFRLRAEGQGDGTSVAEVHPTVALWMWVSRLSGLHDFRYKSSRITATERRALTARLAGNLFDALELHSDTEHWLPLLGTTDREELIERIGHDDNRLDALVAWVLGTLWVSGSSDVIQLGDTDTGAMLLPNLDGLESEWHAHLGDGS